MYLFKMNLTETELERVKQSALEDVMNCIRVFLKAESGEEPDMRILEDKTIAFTCNDAKVVDLLSKHLLPQTGSIEKLNKEMFQ